MCSLSRPAIAVLHYSSPPVIGGVEAVMLAHAHVFTQAGYPVTVVAGRGSGEALPPETHFLAFPKVDSLEPEIERLGATLEKGDVPADFEDVVARLAAELSPVLSRFDHVIVHNVFTKHFNLPLTAALHRLLDQGTLQHCIAWCHDFTWTSPSSRVKVHPGYPWDLLRTYRSDVTYVVVSQQRQKTLAELLDCPLDQIRVIYNGVDPATLLGLSPGGRSLVDRLGLLDCDLVVLMPVRITRAKNIEYALQVSAALKARGCRSKLVVTGPPDPHAVDSLDYFHSLQELRRRLKVEDEVRFVYESGADPAEPLLIDQRVVGDLFRVSDVMFMPSHREGFGMPILESGLTGLLVASTDVPAAKEIGGEDVLQFDSRDDPARTTERLLAWVQDSPAYRLRRRVRQSYTWPAIFRRDIEPLLNTVQT